MSGTPGAASVIRYRPPRAQNDATAWLGMTIFLGSWTIMFAALFFAYAALRIRAGTWPPTGTPALPLLIPGLNTLVLAASGAAMHGALAAARRGRLAAVAPALGLALLLGSSFLGLQLLVWTQLWARGLRINGGPFPSVFYALTVFHGLHVLVGLGGLAWLLWRARSGGHNPGRHAALRLWSGYWHFVGCVWLLIYLFVFVL